MPMAYAIMPVGKKQWVARKGSKTPGSWNYRGFLFRFGRVAYALGWLPLLVIIVQPFADVVGYYTSHNRDNKSSEYISRRSAPLSLPV